MLQQTQEFERQQASVQERLMIVTSSDTPEEATQRLRGPLEKLRKLRLAEQYVDMLEFVESLKDNARGCLPQNPKEALKPYIQLKELAIELQQLQEPAVSLRYLNSPRTILIYRRITFPGIMIKAMPQVSSNTLHQA